MGSGFPQDALVGPLALALFRDGVVILMHRHQRRCSHERGLSERWNRNLDGLTLEENGVSSHGWVAAMEYL